MKSIPQYTSLDAFLHLTPTHLANAQAAVWEAIRELGEATDKEIAEHLTIKTKFLWGTDRVRPRRVELANMDRIRCVGEKQNPITGRRAMVWVVVR